MSNLSKLIEKNKKLITLLGLIVLLVYGGVYGLGITNYPNPGFEGAQCNFYGADFRFNQDWQGTYALHRYQDAETTLVSHSYIDYSWDRIYWGSAGTANDAGIEWHTKTGYVETARPQLGIHVESNIQLSEINRQGNPDPLGYNLTDPLTVTRITYQSKTAVKSETDTTVTYSYNVTEESFLIVPAEFWVGFYLVPSQSNGAFYSQWREGEWQNILLWFRLDWNTWDNAYADAWLNDPQINVFDSPHEGAVLNQQMLDQYRGGFPIAAWIQGWEKAGWTSGGGDSESPTWALVRGKETSTYTFEQLSRIKPMLMAKCSFTPGLVGQFLSMYNQPSPEFEYGGPIASDTDYSADSVGSSIKTQDSRMQKVMYFPINVQNFGTLLDPDSGIVNGWTVYYPTCYFRVRILYGVYGTFTYLWTEELAKDPTVNYPDEIERHQTTVTYTPGPLTGFASWFANPFNQLWLFFVIIVIVLVAVSVLNPGLWTILAGRRRPEG
jgi:hypothetical protein